MNKSADNYIKLTVREGKTIRDTILPFRSADRADCVEAFSRILALSQTRGGTISVYDATPFAQMGEAVPQIGEWPRDDMRRHPLEPENDADEEAFALPPTGTFH